MSYQTDPLGILAPKTVETWEWEKVVHGLGLPCVEFQMLETLIKAAISEFAASDDRVLGSLITAELSFNASVELLYALLRIPMGRVKSSERTQSDSRAVRHR
jgi:hypothetical protein